MEGWLKHASRITALSLFTLVLLGCTQEASDPAPALDATLGPAEASVTTPSDASSLDATSDSDSDADAGGAADESSTHADGSLPGVEAGADANDGQTRARSALVAPAFWQDVDAATDPFGDRPSTTQCAPGAVMAELLGGEPAFSVNTGQCDYVSVVQPSRQAALVGDVVKVRLWHFDLSAPEAAEAHAVVMLGDLKVLDERIAIPQPGGLLARQVTLERALPAGLPVYFHLHNHGANSWSLVEVSTGP
jgi:hypothetical protein